MPHLYLAMKKTTSLYGVICTAILISCNSSHPEETKPLIDTANVSTVVDTAKNTVDDLVRFKFDFAVGNTPSPAEIINDMSSYNLTYNPAFLADAGKASGYKTDFSKSVNLGMYNLDMAYAIANGQGADVLKYLKTSMVEINALGMKSAFDQFIGKRTETNINNKDSLLKIIDELYVKGDSYLRTNQRVETATYIFVGSWIEALHIICSTGIDEKDGIQKARVRKLLWDQRFYLKNIVDLLGEFKDSKEAQSLKNDLMPIHKEIDATPDAKSITADKFKELAAKISGLRNKLAQ